MARANIYLSPELHRQVKAQRIPISEVCQRALWAEVVKRERERTAKTQILWDHTKSTGGQ